LHLSSTVMGYAAAALAGGGLVTLLPAGTLTDRAGPRATVTTAAVVLAVGLALGAGAATPLVVYAAAAVAGAGSGVWRVALRSRVPEGGAPVAAAAEPAAQSARVGTSLLATRQLLLLVGLVAVWMLGPALAAPFFNIFFAREHRLSIERIGFILAAANVCWAIAVLAGGELGRRVGGGRVLVVSRLSFAPALWGLSFAGSG